MQHFDNERQHKIGELVTTIKIMSLIFFMIAILVETPKYIFIGYDFFSSILTMDELGIAVGNIMIFLLFIFSLLFIKYYQQRFSSLNRLDKKKKYIYDVVETSFLIFVGVALVIFTGKNNSPYKIIFLFVMISVTIQHGVKYGIIVSSVCSVFVLAVDVIADPVKPNASLQIDIILVGAFLMITWLVGYYRDVEAQFSLKMANLAKRDDLTGLYSHGYFQLSLSEQMQKAQENNKPLSLMFIDIDYFKYFNDLYGHQAGDEVLKEIAVKIESHLKPHYIAARYGGEEFTVIMYDTYEADAVTLADRIRCDVEESFKNKFPEVGKITVSIGIASFPAKAKNKSDLIKYSDDALYRAKSFHRNRVETYQSVLEELKNDIEENDITIISSIKTLISIINSKDRYTYRHIERVVVYCSMLADALNLSEHDKKILKYGAYLHDIGKINTPEEVLNKKMPLTPEEWDLLKQHPANGTAIISPVKSLEEVIPIILHHHERYDGTGYPSNLSGEDIPYLARVLSVADSFDAMTSHRPYRAAKTFEEGIEELKVCSSTQFDPRIVKVFIEVLRKNNTIFYT